jgi:signal transduction histidine kinase
MTSGATRRKQVAFGLAWMHHVSDAASLATTTIGHVVEPWTRVSRPFMFRLLRYFSITSLIAFLIVTVLLGYFYRRTAVEELIVQEETKNAAVTQAFVNSLRPQLIAYFDTAEGLSAAELAAHPALDDFQREVEAKIVGLPVAKIKIYNRHGVTIFATEREQIGEDDSANAGFLTALGGGVVSELNHRDTFNSYDGVLEDQDVLSTYFPVRVFSSTARPTDSSQGEIRGVFELYSNVTPLLQRIDRAQRNIVLGVALILAILYAILFLVVRHADHIIRRQRAEQLQAEEASRRQQRMLDAMAERERLARDLHDSVAQVLGYLNTQAQVVSYLWAQGQTQTAQQFMQRLVEVVQKAQSDVRVQIYALQSGDNSTPDFPTALEETIEEFHRSSNIEVEVIKRQPWSAGRIAPEVEEQLLKIVQEALTNIRKHAGATHSRIVLDRTEEQTVVTISDDGQGFSCEELRRGASGNTGPASAHLGLRIMRDRSAEIGGSFEVESSPGHGTQVRVTVPLLPAKEIHATSARR